MEKTKRKRGQNYTEAEKSMLIDIVGKYKVIENKNTDASFIVQKRQAWARVANDFNIIATTGPRDWQQLRHVYENMKSKMKKTVAEVNRSQFNKKIDLPIEKTKDTDKENEIESLKKKARDDKKEIVRTGGGGYKPLLSENENKLLALVAPQVTPLSNPYDDGAVYFDDTETESREDTIQEPLSNQAQSEMDSYFEISIETNESSTTIQPPPSMAPSTSATLTEDTMVPSTLSIPISAQLTGSKRMKHQTKKIKDAGRRVDYKRSYFRLKYENAKLERKSILKEMQHKKIKYELEIQILKQRKNRNK